MLHNPTGARSGRAKPHDCVGFGLDRMGERARRRIIPPPWTTLTGSGTHSTVRAGSHQESVPWHTAWQRRSEATMARPSLLGSRKAGLSDPLVRPECLPELSDGS